MGRDVRVAAALITLLILLDVSLVFCQQRCSYMTSIPREPKPDDLPELNFDGVPFGERPFTPGPERDDVCMDDYFPNTPTSGTQIIYMEEEIEGEVPIAVINYNGTQVPFIASFLSGSFNLLGPAIRKEDDKWFLYITQRQDYETPGMQRYMFNVRVDGEPLIAGVTLQIVNIDDNDPIIQAFDACRVPELGDPGLTECVYQVTDADGEISTRFMTFEIDSDRGDEKIFYIQGDNIPNEWYRMTMTVGLNTSLNFETNALHVFRVTAYDSLPNSHTVTLMVQVVNVEHRPPRWIEIFAVQQFDEKTEQKFNVLAIDGDTDINRPIYYRLVTQPEDTFFNITTIEGGREGAVFHVSPIDRDELQREVFQLSIVAYKENNESLYVVANVVIIVNDINDQRPEPLFKEYSIDIMEETPMTLNIEHLGFHDRDLGQNAQYSVHLESVSPPDAAKAFYIAPEVGYQKQEFIMGTLNHSMLDFEVPEYQNITLRVIATDLNRTDFVGVATVNINLINWNDEEPIFEQDAQTVTFNETEGSGFYVATVLAKDRDIDDKVVHSLMGNAGQFLNIDNATGAIHVAINDAFDYHRQSELFVQVRADDTLGEPYHTTTSQLIIRLIDINNTPPSLRLPRGSPRIEENVPEGTEITREIQATDPDTTAELRFEIDWTTSYATKQGRETDAREYHNCVAIETLYPDESNRGEARGRVVVREIRPNVTLDFEEFEVLYLTVRVRDINTEIGVDYDELTFTVIIVDMNDNPPVWSENSLTQELRVRENSGTGIVIGSVLATDIDGPLYNQVRYTIVPRNNTLEDLVKIDFYTGQLSVDKPGAIDADIPPTHYLYYTIIASDRCYEPIPEDCPPDPTYWDTEGNITIYIIDTNNKTPRAETEEFDVVVYVYENATSGDDIVYLVSSDDDRDEMYNTVRYQINYGVNVRLRSFFSVDLDSGRLYVNYTTEETLDRDGDEPMHTIFLNLIDNFYSEGDGNRNQNTTTVEVILLDVNDNAPELPEPHELSWSVLENLAKGVRLEPDIYAPDRDEPDTDNSRVGYAILNLTITNRDLPLPRLFNMIQIQNVTGELETAMDLKGYWGTYSIHILAYDHGHPQQSSEEHYDLVIRPYNFHEPVFLFPQHATTVRLARERAMVNGMLVLVNGEFLHRVTATDEDGLHAGIVTFSVVGNAEAENHFHVVNDGENTGTLMLKQLFTEDTKEFQVSIRATDGGTEPGPLFTDSTLNIIFVPTQGEPVFSVSTAHATFFEKEGGLEESQQLPLAEDPKNYRCTDDCHVIYYRIVDGNQGGHFQLNAQDNILRVVRELDRNTSAEHTLLVAASNSPTGGSILPGSTLTVSITVREANPRPIFVRSLYTAGISTLDTINRELLTLQATHSEGATITYTILNETMQVDPSLEAVRGTAFVLNPTSGVLTLNMQPTASMHGMFQFQVLATDTEGATDTANVKIYLISSMNRVFFIFVNTLEQIEKHKDFIAQTFSIGFSMTCNVDQVVPATESSGVALDDLTEVRAHFIRDNTPVTTDVIEELRSDTTLLRTVQTTLNTELLVLRDLVTGDSPTLTPAAGRNAVYVLAGLCALLALICLVLLITFFVKSRALKRRLEALSMTKYGSQDSGLNRAGLAAPGTNKHATEGSNPIWNEAIKAPDFDAISGDSDDSDLIGIENLPQFREDYFPPENSSMRDVDVVKDNNKEKDTVANHSNNFQFNTTPFSPQFANDFKR
ncbi:PREDICTED: cadherin-23-like isoform X1 [Papilio xuthus]|uniref:Cadherin-23-like isoform X1 n=1 Tax=Papilio xuthus TaxID=66420 RepID=A0AAJ6Z8D1_PAPXU|nr:PREDICTED: cadherin-23-like isoform X1 [Papilio xuthus]